MSAASDILKNFNLFVDGRGFAGNIDTLKLPTLTVKIEDYLAGGLDSPVAIDMGLEPIETQFTLSKFDKATLALWGVGDNQKVPLRALGALESQNGTVTPVEVVMRGKMTVVEPSEWTAGSKATLQFTLRLSYYKYTQGGTVVHEIDVENMIRKINGVDRNAAIRGAIGL